MIKKESINPLRFKVSGNLIKELGEESISNPNVAMLELIKNAYDADAANVGIEIIDINKPNETKMKICDDGEGMNYTEIENKWMCIASPHKTDISKTTKGRIPVGAKGIGRLASESLGRKTILDTCRKSEKNGYEIHFNWDEYRKDNIQCNDVNNNAYRFEKKLRHQGTSIEICNLRDSWNDSNKLKELLRDIYLIHPLNAPLTGFKINPKFALLNISLKQPDKKIFDYVVYMLKAKLTNRNIVEYSFCKGNNPSKVETKLLDSSLKCGDVSFDLYFFYRAANLYKERLNKVITSSELETITSFLDEYGGIRLYRDNFRVKPYGEKGFDWLEMEPVAQKNTMCPRGNQIVGIVNISKTTNPEIVDTTTREGIIHTPEFLDIIKFIRTCVMEIFIDKRSEIESDKMKARKKSQRRKIRVAKPSDTKSTEELIKVEGNYPQNFYYKLHDEINRCYSLNCPNATFFLCRKLIENLVSNILEKKFRRQVDLWFDRGNRRRLFMSILENNLYTKRSDFNPTAQQNIEKFHTLVGKFMKDANASVHYIINYFDNKNELLSFKVPDMVQLLINIYQTL